MAGVINEEHDTLTSVTLTLSQDYSFLKSRQGSDKSIKRIKEVSARACEMSLKVVTLGRGILNGPVPWV